MNSFEARAYVCDLIDAVVALERMPPGWQQKRPIVKKIEAITDRLIIALTLADPE